MNIKEQIKLLERIKSEIKTSQTVIDLFREKGVDLELIHLIPMCFADVPVSARTQHGIIYFNKDLLDKIDQINHYMTHEITHVLQQCFGDKPTQGASVGEYLENPYEIEGFQKQVEFISEEKDINQAEKYVNKVLNHHKVPKDEREEKKEELMAEASKKQTSFDFTNNDTENFSKDLLKKLDEETPITKARKDKMKLQEFEKDFRLMKLKQILEMLDDKINDHKKAFLLLRKKTAAGLVDANKILFVDKYIDWALKYYTTQVKNYIIETINEIKDIDSSDEPMLLKQDLVERYLLLNKIKNVPEEHKNYVKYLLPGSSQDDKQIPFVINFVLESHEDKGDVLSEDKDPENKKITMNLYFDEKIDSLGEYERNIKDIIDTINHESVHVLQFLYGYGMYSKTPIDPDNSVVYELKDEEFYPIISDEVSNFNKIYKDVNPKLKSKIALIWVNGFAPNKDHEIMKSVYRKYLAMSNFFKKLSKQDPVKWRKACKIFLAEVLK